MRTFSTVLLSLLALLITTAFAAPFTAAKSVDDLDLQVFENVTFPSSSLEKRTPGAVSSPSHLSPTLIPPSTDDEANTTRRAALDVPGVPVHGPVRVPRRASWGRRMLCVGLRCAFPSHPTLLSGIGTLKGAGLTQGRCGVQWTHTASSIRPDPGASLMVYSYVNDPARSRIWLFNADE